jgi:hypothetical protein
VEAGFTPIEAIHVATENGARFLAEEDRIGTGGYETHHPKYLHIDAVEIVFKDGVGYDSAKLIDSVRGLVGLR